MVSRKSLLGVEELSKISRLREQRIKQAMLTVVLITVWV